MKKRIAAIVTEYRPRSHADVIVGKLLNGYDLDGVWTEPRLEVASLYTDQIPESDMSRAVAAQHGVPIFGSIDGALTLGGDRLAVDGVVLIGEHGQYPINPLGQQMYPRRRFFEETIRVFERSGRVVPVFSDKHLSYSWENARWMYDTARAMGVPFMAGSSLPTTSPTTWRRPALEIRRGAVVEEALGIGYGGLDSYGFHALEMVQCMVERRFGGESGVAAVRCVEWPAIWEAGRYGAWSPELLDAAYQRLTKRPDGDPKQLAREPAAFLVEYRDGLRVTVLMLNGVAQEFGFAARVDGKVESTLFYLDSTEPFGHFAFQAHKIEEMILTGAAPEPIERTLLTSGILALALESRYRDHLRLPTPEFAIAY